MILKNSYSTYRLFIIIAIIVWVLSYIGEIFIFLPYSNYGLFISPLLMILGIIGYCRLKITYKDFPDLISEYHEILERDYNNTTFGSFFAFYFTLVNRLPSFATFWFLCWMVMTHIMTYNYRGSTDFVKVKHYLLTQNEVISTVGNIEYYSFLGNIESSGGYKEINFSVKGSVGKAKIKIKYEFEGYYFKVYDLGIKYL